MGERRFFLFSILNTQLMKQRIVVVGGGFAGLNFIKKLDKDKFEVRLVDRDNYHGFPPLFYQVASSGLDPTSISFPFRRELRRRRCEGARFHLGQVKGIDVEAKTVTTQYETLPYDKLVIAAGTTNNFFGDATLPYRVYTIKATDEAIRCRNEILFRCERAAMEPDPEKRRRMLTFVVIGGGPAGVEIAGAIGEVKRYIIPRDYPEIQRDDMSIHLIEGSDRLLRAMSPNASRHALQSLNSLMVNVMLNHVMRTYDDNVVRLDDGQEIYSEMVIWTAGVTGSQIRIASSQNLQDAVINRQGRFVTDQYCQVKQMEGVYAIGDIGYCEFPDYPRGLPQLAQVAIQQGKFLAKGLNEGKFDKPFKYDDRGSMATIGRNRAVADIGCLHLTGFPAWLAWMFIHLMSLLGVRSKISVLVNWVWAYFTYNTALRLLLKGSKYPLRGDMHDRE